MRFQVQLVDRHNQLKELLLEASSRDSLTQHPQLRDCTILQVKSVGLDWLKWLAVKRSGRFQVLLFSRELMALLAAGLSLIEAIDTLAEKEVQADSRAVLEQLRTALYQGRSLSDALSGFPELFSEFYIATIRASERTSSMVEALQRYIRYQEQADVLRKRMVSASIYPAVLLFVGFLVTIFLMFYVVPRFGGIYEEMRGDIPFFSQLLLQWGHFFAAYRVPLLSGFVLSFTALLFAISRTEMRIWLWQKLFRMPVAGRQLQLLQLSRLYRTLGMLLRGGIPVVAAIEMSKGQLSLELQPRLTVAMQQLREGLPLSQVMEQNQLHTPVASRLIRVGERTGELGEMLERTAEFMDEELSRWIEWFSKVFEPLIMAFIGLFIGLIVVLMYMPIFELASNIQ